MAVVVAAGVVVVVVAGVQLTWRLLHLDLRFFLFRLQSSPVPVTVVVGVVWVAVVAAWLAPRLQVGFSFPLSRALLQLVVAMTVVVVHAEACSILHPHHRL